MKNVFGPTEEKIRRSERVVRLPRMAGPASKRTIVSLVERGGKRLVKGEIGWLKSPKLAALRKKQHRKRKHAMKSNSSGS
ncbi:hypothetical protein [Nitrobacter sp.]|uniref:hypothetical protein n=1 Tax=Nitrobacter sp. TaxID=29420 RepID=UPI00321FA6B2